MTAATFDVSLGGMTSMENLDLSKLKILLVDDYPPMRLILGGVLRELSVTRIDYANDGEEALVKLWEVEPDIVITDTIMEGMDGLELTKRIRTGHEGVDAFLPVIMVSASTGTKAIVKARDSGITEFLAKPISPHMLYLRLCAVIASKRPFVRTDGFFGPDRRRKETFVSQNRRDISHEYAADEGAGDAAADEGAAAA